MRKRILSVLTAMLVVVLGMAIFTACNGDNAITLSQTELVLEVGQTKRLTAAAGDGAKITWESKDDSIATVTAGLVKGVKSGKTEIVAKSESGATAVCSVTVENVTVEISGEKLQNGKLTLERFATTKLSAVVKKDATVLEDGVTWTSSDDSIVTVADDGTVTAVAMGTAKIVATRVNGSARAEIDVEVVWAGMPTGWYALKDWEQNKITPNLWGYWVDAGYEAQYQTNVKVLNAEYLGDPTGTGLVAGGVTLTYENQGTGMNEHGVQLFYRSSKGYTAVDETYKQYNAEIDAGKPYDAKKLLLDVNASYLLKMDITVTASGTITVNGMQVDVVANEKQSLEVPFTHTDSGAIYPEGVYDNVGSAVFLMMGANGRMINAATVTIENVSWESWNGESSKLATPTLAVDGKQVTITDTNTVGVRNYTIGLFEKNAEADAVPVRSVNVNGKTATIDDSKWPNGSYELRVRANGKDARYEDSAWSAGVDYTVSHGSVTYDLVEGSSTEAKTDLSDTYYYYTEGATVTTATYNDGVITLEYSGNNTWTSMQLFYKNPTLTGGQKYTLTFTLNSPLAGKIRINGAMFDLKAGDNEIEVTYTEGSGADGLSINIQFGEPTSDYQGTASALEGGKFVLKDILWTKYEEPEGTLSSGGQADAVANPGKFYLWWDEGNWNGSLVTMNAHTIDVEGKIINFSYTATGDDKYGSGVQLFYEHPGVKDGQLYTITLTIKVSVACDITVCGSVEHFDANVARTVTISRNEPGNAGQYNEGATISVIMGTNDGKDVTNVKEAEVTVSDWSVTEASATKLGTPTGLSIAEDGTVTFTEPADTTGVKGYELGFFQGETQKGTVAVTKGGKLDDSALENGTYTVKVRALGTSDAYATSEWSQGVEYTVENEGGPSYNIETCTDENAVVGKNDGKYYVWKEKGNATGTYSGGKATVTATGNTGNWYNVQIFMKDPSLEAGKTYKVTMTITVNASGKIKVNGVDPVTVEADVPFHFENAAWVENANAASVSIQLGSGSANATIAENCTITIEDVVFTEAAKLHTPTLAVEGKVVTITDDNEGATYELGFFKNAEDAAPAHTLTIANGGTINDEMVEEGAYTLKVRATKVGSTPSDWSQGVEYTVEKGDLDYTIIQSGGEENSNGKWIYWADGTVSVEYVRLYEEEGGKYKIAVKESSTGSVAWGFQLFYNDSENFPNGTKCTVKMTANAKEAMQITVGGQTFDLVANEDKAIEVAVTPGYVNDPGQPSLIDIQVPQQSGKTYEFELKDISWEKAAESGPEPGPVEGSPMTKLTNKDASDLVKGQWSYYAAEGVTVKNATVSGDGKTVTITVSGLTHWDDVTIYYTPEGYEDSVQHTLVADYLFTSELSGACTVTLNHCTAGGESGVHKPGYTYNQPFNGQGLPFVTTDGIFYNITLGQDTGDAGTFPNGEVTVTLSNITLA